MERNTVIFNLGVTLLAGFVLGGTLLGCSSEKKTNDKRFAIGKCNTAKDTSLNQQNAIQKSTVTIIRGSQKVKYKDCDQNEFLSQKNQVQHKSKLAFAPQANLKMATGQLSISVYNRSTCEGGNFRTNNKSAALDIPVSLEKSDKHLLLTSDRTNFVDYEIRACDKTNSDQHCTSSDIIEKGTLVLTVKNSYAQTQDIQEVTVCRQPKKATPHTIQQTTEPNEYF